MGDARNPAATSAEGTGHGFQLCGSPQNIWMQLDPVATAAPRLVLTDMGSDQHTTSIESSGARIDTVKRVRPRNR